MESIGRINRRFTFTRVLCPPLQLTAALLCLVSLTDGVGLFGRLPSANGSSIIELKNGLELRGEHAAIASLDDDILAAASGAGGNVNLQLVLFVDDGLRRTFFSKYQLRGQREDPELIQTIRLDQPVADAGGRVGRVGSILNITPFDSYGRRTCTLVTADETASIVQGISEVSPLWTRIDGLIGSRPYIWDMRVATSSIPRDVLSQVLREHLGNDDPDKRLQVVKLYLQSERYQDAERELRDTIRDFPELANLQQMVTELEQLKAKQILEEIKNLRAAGQHQRALAFLKNFPANGIANETLIQVQDILREYEDAAKNAKRAMQIYSQGINSLEQGPQRDKLLLFQDKIESDLGYDTVGRLTAFLNLADDENVTAEKKLTAEQKLSLAVSGWILGSANSDNNLAVSISLIQVQDLVREYLAAKPADEARRSQILEQLNSLEGSNPTRVAQMLELIPPPRRTDELERQISLATIQPAEGKTDNPSASRPKQMEVPATRFGMFELTVPTPTGEARYLVQLPPEYHPLRRYPTIVTLHSSRTTAEQQMDWWAGVYDPKTNRCLGQAARHGYIVIAPRWAAPRQRKYEYTVAEHAAVLASLRDATHRFSVDTDRVFLSGHETGGDAAWDIGLAHPDLWAGVIPIGAVSHYEDRDAPKYVIQYWENAKNVPLYFVGGALAERKPRRSAVDLDRYFTHVGYDTMVVEYLGRGNESFSDEIIRLFDWMKNHRRAFFPKEFRAGSMRSSDNFFYWLEVSDLPEQSIVSPLSWPVKSTSPTFLEGEVRTNGVMSIKSAARQTTVWFSPEMLDLNQRIKIRLNTVTKMISVSPNVETILDDVRGRGDRQHPFWAQETFRSGPN